MRAAPVIAAALLTLAAAACTSTTTTPTVSTQPANAGPATASSTAAPTSAAPASVAATSKPPAKAGVGSTIELQGHQAGDVLAVTVVKVVDPAKATDGFSTPEAGKRYVAVQIKLVNKGHATYNEDPVIVVKAMNAAGESFDPEVSPTPTNAGQPIDTNLTLAPGDTALGVITFQVPTETKLTKLQYAVSAFGGNAGQWVIG